MPCCTIERVEATPFLSRLEEDQQRVRYKYGVLQSLLYVKISKCQSVIQAFNISSVHPIRNIVIMGLFIMNGFIAWNSQKILHLKQDVHTHTHTHTHARSHSRSSHARTHARPHSRTHARVFKMVNHKAAVARDIGVPESTLRGWCKTEDKIMS